MTNQTGSAQLHRRRVRGRGANSRATSGIRASRSAQTRLRAAGVPPLSLAFDPGGDDPTRADIVFRLGARAERRAFIQSKGQSLNKSGDALLCLGLAPAMELGADLVIEAPVSAELLENAGRIQDLLCDWYPGYRRISIRAETAETILPRARGAGLFYSGGVDSSYSLLNHQHEIDALVTVIGADVGIADSDRVASLRQAVSEVSHHYGLEAILVTTDIRNVSDRMIGWVEYHAAFLTAVGHLLGERFGTVTIASSGSERAKNIPWGSNPNLDPLYGTSAMRIHHDTAIDRFTKLKDIVDEPALMKHLRVCSKSDPNCNECPKCGFVMHELAVLNAQDKSPTFERRNLRDVPLAALDLDNLYLERLRDAARLADASGVTAKKADRTLRAFAVKHQLKRLLSLDGWALRFKRFKRRRRYLRDAAGR